MWKLTVTHVLEELFESMHRLPFNYKNRSRLSRRLSRFDETQPCTDRLRANERNI